jgi:hypothetical protein
MHENRDNPDEQGAQMPEGALAGLNAGGLDPLPLSIAESLFSLIMNSQADEPGGADKAETAQAAPAEPTADHAADGADELGACEPQLTASAGWEIVPIEGDDDQPDVSPLEPVPASISGLLSSACAEIEAELIEDGSTPQGLDGFDHVLMTSVGRMPNVRHAHGVETVVELERGRWTVDVVVIFPDGLVRHRIDTFHTKARADISARLIKRTAERELQGPFDV